MAGHFVR